MANGRVAALKIPGGSELSRSEIDAYTEFVKIYGAKGLAYIKVNDVTQLDENGLQSPIVKNIHIDNVNVFEKKKFHRQYRDQSIRFT